MLSPSLQQVDRTFVIYRNKRYSYFSGCDYFRLASHPDVLLAVQEGLSHYGLNVAASRTTTGNHSLYPRLERRLAKFFGCNAAVVVSSGYLTNIAVAEALHEEFSHVLVDDKSHGSLADAVQFLGRPVIPFRHCDVEDLRHAVRVCGTQSKPVLLSDGVFSFSGEIAPFAAYLNILPPQGMLLIDDAHGAGVLGETGKGSHEFCHIPRTRIIQTITLSKAFGVYGGAILCSTELAEKILHTHVFVGNTPLPLPLVCGALKSLDLLASDNRLRMQLMHNVAYVRSAIHAVYPLYPLAGNPSPIISIVPHNAKEAERLKKNLLAHDIFPPFIHYPGGPQSGYFRFAISSEHSRTQLDSLIAVLCSS
jgi:glycine C-acetyltransferase/8-amino-7-oxononanoate synthase